MNLMTAFCDSSTETLIHLFTISYFILFSKGILTSVRLHFYLNKSCSDIALVSANPNVSYADAIVLLCHSGSIVKGTSSVSESAPS